MASDGNSERWQTLKTKPKRKPKPKYISDSISGASTSGGSTSSNTGPSSNLTPVKLCCNHFIVQHEQPLPTIHQYKVTIQSKRNISDLRDVESKGLKRKIFNALRKNKEPELDRSAYNGDSDLYSTRPLADIENEPNEVRFPRRERNPDWVPLPGDNGASSSQPEEVIPDLIYVVTIKFVKQSPPDPREGKSFPKYVFVRIITESLVWRKMRAKTWRFRKVSTPASGLHTDLPTITYPGYPGTRLPRLVLNFRDVRTAVLISKPIQSFIKDLFRRNIDLSKDEMEFTSDEREEVNAALSGVRVQTNLGPKYLRRYTIQELDHQRTSENTRFKIKKGKKKGQRCNVRQHFYWYHKYILKKPRWPLLRMRGGENDLVYIPIEVCTIVDGQRYKRLSPEQRSGILAMGKVSPDQKKNSIENSLNDTAATYETHNGLLSNGPPKESFGITIGRKMIEVEGQILPAPTLHYGDRRRLQLWEERNDGTGISNFASWNVEGQKMATPVSLKNQEWAVYVFYNGGRYLNKSTHQYEAVDGAQGEFLAKNLRSMFTRMGMLGDKDEPTRYLSEPAYMQHRDPDQRIEFMLGKAELPTKLIVAVLPSKSPDLYVPLKRICETIADGRRMVITQCVIMEKRVELSQKHLANLSLKINLKMGGNNSNVDPPIMTSFLGEPPEKPTRTCIFGIDVSHGSTGDVSKPSIAAVVASVEDRKWSRYAPQVRKQAAKQERVEKLQEMVVDLLREFNENLGYYPGQIIVYRDGVSESQFRTVGHDELGQFREACETAYEENGDKIPITFIIVQKRHHTRFFAPKIRDNETEFQNMNAGTVVTSQVCQTQNEDFYLCSHKSLEVRDRVLNQIHQLVTSRPAHYTVFDDGIKLGQSKIQNLTNYLCYCFGRATSAVSIPAPVYYAHVAAKHYSYFLNKDAAGSEATLRNINDKLTKAPYRMFYI